MCLWRAILVHKKICATIRVSFSITSKKQRRYLYHFMCGIIKFFKIVTIIKVNLFPKVE